MILRSFLSSKCSFEHIECSHDNPNERKIVRQKSRSHSLNVRKWWRSFFRGITIIKFFCWNWVTQFWQPWGKHFSGSPKDFARCTKFLVVFFQNKPSKMFFWSKHCFFDKFSEEFRPVDWKVFVQPPGPILRSFSSS